MTEWGQRARGILSEYFVVAVAAAVIVACLGGWLVYTTHIEPGTETQQEVQSSWESSAGYAHSATVTEPNRVFPIGDTLEDRSLYYAGITPELDGAFEYHFAATGGQLEVDADHELVIQSINEEEDPFWRVTEPLDSQSTTLQPGDSLTTEFTLNATEIALEIEDIEEELGASPGETQAFVRTDIDAEGTAAGNPAEHTESYRLTLLPGTATYEVEADEATEQHEHVEPVTSEIEHGIVRMAAGPALVLVGLLGLFGLGVGRHREAFELSAAERAAMELASEREEFNDWISTGRVPEAARGREAVEISSLEDLVDTAIDSDRRVIYDSNDGVYHVIDETQRYEYRPEIPPSAVAEELDGGLVNEAGETDETAAADPLDDAATNGGDATEVTDGAKAEEGE